MGLGLASALGLLFMVGPRMLLAFFGMQDEITVELATQLLRFLAVSGLFISVALAYTGGLQGTGDTRSPLYISLVSQLAVPLGICFVVDAIWGLPAVVIWAAIVLGHGTRAILSILRFRQEHWRSIRVDIGADPAGA
jgi:Na+-driven multidrug efflux pump